jgi:2'-5' RNA ligase
MHGIVALLDDEHTSKVDAIWGELHDSCGLTCIQMTPFPHFSWHIAEKYDFDHLEEKLALIARQMAPFTIRTAGLGVFTGKNLVVYITIVKDSQLLELHQHIWKETQSMGSGVSPLYAPDQWMPHITLANRDVTDNNLPCIFSTLGGHSFSWEIQVNRFALGYQENDAPGEITKTFSLNSK